MSGFSVGVKSVTQDFLQERRACVGGSAAAGTGCTICLWFLSGSQIRRRFVDDPYTMMSAVNDIKKLYTSNKERNTR
jgi:hypothetical protein